MKLFHISDVLSATTGRLVSSRHMDAIYDIYNFLTGDSLFTHQLPRVIHECQPWLRTQYPMLMEDHPTMAGLLDKLREDLDGVPRENNRISAVCKWVEAVRETFDLPEMIPVYELGADMHTHIDPIEEAEAMVGEDRVIVLGIDDTGE